MLNSDEISKKFFKKMTITGKKLIKLPHFFNKQNSQLISIKLKGHLNF